MTKLLTFTLVLCFNNTLVHANESWIEGRWIGSRDYTIDELAHGDPEGKSELEALMGEIDAVWIVESGTIQIVRSGKKMEPAIYFIRPIREGVFEMLFDLASGDQQHVIIHRKEYGFCYQYGGDYSHEPAPDMQECYVRDGA